MNASASTDRPAAGNHDAVLLERAGAPETTPFDYIVVGSGAGGGPLAARLARAGKKVLVLEAGRDPSGERSQIFPQAGPGEVSQCPGYHPAATEEWELSWQFSVRHYGDDARQKKDRKYNQLDGAVEDETGHTVRYPCDRRFLDPAGRGAGKGGIFYPRSAALGGCTAHHAMILVAPNDKDWNHIADLTGDDSWRAERMQGYLARVERCLYIEQYNKWFRRLLGVVFRLWRWIALQFDPRGVLDRGGHGDDGWQPTTFIDPSVVEGIAREDRRFFRVLIRTALSVLHAGFWPKAALQRALFKSRVVQQFDPNDLNTRRVSPEGVFFIPTGIESGKDLDEKQTPMLGRRSGVREFLLKTKAEHPENLVIKTGVHVTRVIFRPGEGNSHVPRAAGVEAVEGDDLYEASPLCRSDQPAAAAGGRRYFARGEIILCGGAFNTPQLLMLSGIGDKAHLQEPGIGIKGPCDAGGEPVSDIIDLPGVGRNLQDRYEVSVISEVDGDFSSLQGASFCPGDNKDGTRQKWMRTRKGLYGTNGGTLAIMRRSPAVAPDEPEPDVFIFGVPAAFRGYYWGWSREIFRPKIGDGVDQRNLWSWAILKAYTHNNGGTVRLRSNDAFACPEICFHSFDENAEDPVGWKKDLAAVADAVEFIRRINAKNTQFVNEIEPGPAAVNRPEGRELDEWIRNQAWGHHCSCTCRMGSDKWQEDAGRLADRQAVLDSRFRVHGVKGLRVVDASVFPKIPGYFIALPLFMVSEKAADTILEDAAASHYPREFEAAEAAAIRRRRLSARLPPERESRRARQPNNIPDPQQPAGAPPATLHPEDAPGEGKLPGDTVGLALSGGGIRSATFSLGVMQALAEGGRLREVDMLSTVSGGGFTGSFLGRLFTRDVVRRAADPCGRVQDTLANVNSGPLWWLRTQANYIFATGASDLRLNLAIFWRNIFTVHLVVGALFFTIFGLLAWLPQGAAIYANWLGWQRLMAAAEPALAPPMVRGLALSVWWWLPLLAFAVGILPATLGYWLAPRIGSYRPYPLFSLLAWLVVLVGAGAALLIPGALPYAVTAAVTAVLAWVWQEAARWDPPHVLHSEAARWQTGRTVRNRLSRHLGAWMALFGALVAWVILDTFAARLAEMELAAELGAVVAALAPVLPWLRRIGLRAQQEKSGGAAEGFSIGRLAYFAGLPLALVLLLALDVFAHKLFIAFPGLGWGLVVILFTGVISVVIGRAFDFLNQSSLHAIYAARLTRTFQGASNEERVYTPASHAAQDVNVAHPKDDIPHHRYHPEEQGGPLHLINVCVNETVDIASEREVRERRGLPMCVTPHGVSVGRRYFARWSAPDALPLWQRFRRWRDGLDAGDTDPFLVSAFKWLRRGLKPGASESDGENEPGTGAPQGATSTRPAPATALRAIPASSDPHGFHVLASRTSSNAEVEPLTLGAWTAISGAAFSTGLGRGTTLPLSLLLGLTNIRLGYWWDSGIHYQERPGRFPASLWRKLERLPISLCRMQSMLLAEWRARFHGPSRWFWYLSDGGHFENTGLYELLRRRVRFMIAVDAGQDASYQWGDIALLTQQARMDFGAQIEWLDLHAARVRADAQAASAAPHPGPKPGPWEFVFNALPGKPRPPAPPDPWIREWLDLGALGALGDIGRKGGSHAALARVTYAGTPEEVCWILLLKPSLTGNLTMDISNYAAEHSDFPQQPTFDQVFDDRQWECYRALGQQIGRKVLLPVDAPPS